MLLDSLRIRNFRNISNLEIEFGPKSNFFIGPNAQGKTSILEAIHLLSDFSSFREVDLQQLIQKGKDQSSVWLKISEGDWTSDLEAHLFWDEAEKSLKKTSRINQKNYSSRAHYLKEKHRGRLRGFHSIVFVPSSVQLVMGAPSLRRKFINRVISGQDENYFSNILKYEKILKLKNSYLKQGGVPGALWEVLHEQFIECSSEITLKRLAWLQDAFLPFRKSLEIIAPHQGVLVLSLLTKRIQIFEKLGITRDASEHVHFPLQGPLPSLQDLKAIYREELNKVFNLERQRGFVLLGPHRDDILFQTDNGFLKDSGSQGEVRSALLALKMAEIELYRTATGLRPVLLIDDFSSELDETRRHAILEHLLSSDLQSFVTTTEERFFGETVFQVNDGNALKTRGAEKYTYGDRTSDTEERLHSR